MLRRAVLPPLGGQGASQTAINGSFNASASIPMITSVAGDTLFCNGVRTTPVSVFTGEPGVAQAAPKVRNAPRVLPRLSR